jgi:hypothetical protein
LDPPQSEVDRVLLSAFVFSTVPLDIRNLYPSIANLTSDLLLPLLLFFSHTIAKMFAARQLSSSIFNQVQRRAFSATAANVSKPSDRRAAAQASQGVDAD